MKTYFLFREIWLSCLLLLGYMVVLNFTACKQDSDGLADSGAYDADAEDGTAGPDGSDSSDEMNLADGDDTTGDSEMPDGSDDGSQTDDAYGDLDSDGGSSDDDEGSSGDIQSDGGTKDGDDNGTVTRHAPEPDVDGDGKTDLIFVSADPAFARRIVLKSRGDGFETLCRSESESPCNIALTDFLQYENTKVLPGDYNGDGLTDLFLSSGMASSPGRTLLLSNGASFEVACDGTEDNACGTDSESYMIHSQTRYLVGEFTGDERSDILVISGDPEFERVSLLASTGQGFGPVCVGQAPGTCGIDSIDMLRAPATRIITGDFSGDGMDDFLAVSCGGGVVDSSLYLALPGQGFQRICSTEAGNACGFDDIDCSGDGTNHLIAGDYNGDGKMDIFSVSGDLLTPSRRLLLSNGQGFSVACSGVEDGDCGTDYESYMQHDLSRFVPGDFDGDGRTDLLILSGEESFTRRIVLVSDGQSFHVACVGFSDGDCGIDHMGELVHPGSRVRVGDFNGDGKDDLFVMSIQSAYRALLLSNGGEFVSACSGDADGICGVDSEPYTRMPATRLLPGVPDQQALVYYGYSIFSPVDMTARLQAALGSGIRELRLDGPPETRYITGPLSIVHDHTRIRFSPSVVLEAKSGAYPGLSDSVLAADGLNNIQILGAPNAKIRMLKSEYQDGEWRMGIRMTGVWNATISDLEISDTGGDGIYLGHSGAEGHGPCRDILIDKVHCINNSRQGISIISASNVSIQNSLFEQTKSEGAAIHGPWDGIDLEPNHAYNLLENIVVSDSVFLQNDGCGFHAYLGHLDASSSPISVSFLRCEYNSNAKYGICIGGAENNAPGSIEIRTAYISGNSQGSMSIGAHPNLSIVQEDIHEQ